MRDNVAPAGLDASRRLGAGLTRLWKVLPNLAQGASTHQFEFNEPIARLHRKSIPAEHALAILPVRT